MADRTLLIVNFNSAALTARAIETARLSSSVPLRTIVVDNSESAAEVERLRLLPIDDLVVAESNLGYGRAINRVTSRVGRGALILSNPDVEYSGSAVDVLCSAVESNADMAGPMLFWDSAMRWMLPPAEATSVASKVAQIVHGRFSSLRSTIDQRRCRQRVGFWTEQRDTRAAYVSGAVIATRPEVLERLGGFDERFRLYFEEIDLMRRLKRKGGTVRVVRGAQCRHLFNQSSASPAESGRLYAESEELYLRKWSTPAGLAVLRRFSGKPAFKPEAVRLLAAGDPIILPGDPASYVVEASPLRSFWSAAGYFPRETEVRFPPEITRSYRGQQLFVRVVDLRTLRPWPGLEFEISVK